MAIIVGLTGGIGSGKTSVMKHIERLGYKVYYTDDAGKKVMQKREIVEKIQSIFNENVILEDGQLDRKNIASIVFSNPEKLKALNQIVHPAVAHDFLDFISKLGKDEIVVKESAILFESKANKDCDFVILVTAPKEIRIKRVMERDGVSKEEVEKRMKNQISEEEKEKKSNFVINNIDLVKSFEETELILKKIIKN